MSQKNIKPPVTAQATDKKANIKWRKWQEMHYWQLRALYEETS